MIIAVNEADGFALSMIAILGLSFSFVLVIFVGIIRQGKKAATDEERLIDEVSREERPEPAGDRRADKPAEPWERESDWWKSDK